MAMTKCVSPGFTFLHTHPVPVHDMAQDSFYSNSHHKTPKPPASIVVTVNQIRGKKLIVTITDWQRRIFSQNLFRHNLMWENPTARRPAVRQVFYCTSWSRLSVEELRWTRLSRYGHTRDRCPPRWNASCVSAAIWIACTNRSCTTSTSNDKSGKCRFST